MMAERRDRIRVHIEGKEFSVVGGNFQEMLAAVKQINGRRFVGELKVWQLPGTVEEVRRQLEISSFQLEGGAPVKTDNLPVAPVGDRIRLQVGEHSLTVVGGGFQEMLAVVKTLPGRRFNGETKIWEIPAEPGLIKGMIEAAGFQLEGAENIAAGDVSSMEKPDFGGHSSPPPYEAPDFLDQDEAPPYEPPDWWDEMPPPPIDDNFDPGAFIPPDDQPPPFEAQPPGPKPAAAPTPGSDRIRIRLGETALVVSGGSFQELLAAVKNIPGRRFNAAEKVWEIPEDITLDSVQQAISAAGFILEAE